MCSNHKQQTILYRYLHEYNNNNIRKKQKKNFLFYLHQF